MIEKIAVLIDFENIAAGTEKDGMGRFDVECVLQRVKDKGRILIARSYADWGRFARFKQTLLTNNVTMMELTSHGMQDKNRADIALVVDALELAFTRDYIDTFVIVSGDSDFTPLVLKMRELDKRVIGCGCRSSTSRLLVQACDEFIFYDNIYKSSGRRRARPSRSSDRSNTKAAPGRDLEAAFDLLAEAVEGLQREIPDPPRSSVVKNAMQRKDPAFSESELGFSSFGRFLEVAQRGGLVTLDREPKSGSFRVGMSENGTPEQGSPAITRTPADPYLPKGVGAWVDVLEADGLNPLSAPVRKAILDALEESVDARTKRKRRISAQFVQEDVRKKLKKTHPDVPGRGIRAVFNGLMRTGSFIHRDGTPIRTMSAAFTLDKDAEALNKTLVDIYLDLLNQSQADLSDVELLAELFYGHREQRRQIEETLAYQQVHSEEDMPTADLDSLLDVETTEEVPLPAPTAPAADDLLLEEAPAKPKRKRTRKKAEPAADVSDEAPAKPKRTRKKATPAADATSADDKPKRRTRRKTKAQKDAEVTDAGDAAIDLDATLQIED